MSTVNVEQVGRVRVIELARPDALNAMDIAMRQRLVEAFDAAARDVDTHVVVLAAQGRAFCSGADLKSAAANSDQSLRRTARTLLHDFQPLLECMARMDKPVIAAVNGPAVGVGMSLVLGCDLIVMAEDSYLLSPFVNIGLVPDGGAAWLLQRRIGYGRTLEVLLEAEKLGARKCFDLGICNRVAEADVLRDEVMTWANKLADKAPMATALTKRVARMSGSIGFSEALTLEAELQTFCASTEDSKEAVRAFAEKRKPVFTGR